MRLILLLIFSLPCFALDKSELPAPDGMNDWLRSAGVPGIPPSHWSHERREWHAAYLEGSTFDLIVVPAQVQRSSVDIAARGVITRAIAEAAQGAGWSVAPVDLVRGALGEFARSVDRQAVAELADVLEASTVVETFVGHDATLDYPRLTVSVVAYRSTPAGLQETGAFHRVDVPVSDVDTPERVVMALLPNVLSELGLDRRPEESEAVAADDPAKRVAVPASLRAMAESGDLSLRHSIRYWQLLGGLLPSYASYERSRFFEQTLVAARSLPEGSMLQTLVEAWACYYLDRRPLGLHLLHDLPGAEADFLRAALMGDAIGMGNSLSGIDAPVPRLLATLEWIRLARRYDLTVPEATFDALASAYPDWDVFIRVRLDDGNRWKRMQRGELNAGIAAVLAASEVTSAEFLGQVATNAQAISDYAGATSPIGKVIAGIDQPMLLPPEIHLQTLRDRLPPCCPENGTFSQQDVYAFLEAQVHAYRWELIAWELFTRSRPEAAMAIVDEVGLFYAGHFMWEYLRGMSALHQAHALDESEQKRQKVAEYRFFRARSVMLAPGVTGWVPAAMNSWEFDPYRDEVMAKHGDSEAAVLELGIWLYALHQSEFPRKPNAPAANYHPDAADREPIYRRQSLDYVTADPDRYFDWIKELRDTGHGDEVLTELASSPMRFRGSVGRAEWQATAALWNSGLDAALESLLMDIAAGVSSYDITHLYADYLARAGRNEEAWKVLSAHPRVRAPRQEFGGSVDYANTQAHVARHFLQLGEPELARPFYERAAMAGSGASAEISSRRILAGMADRWHAALAEVDNDHDRYGGYGTARDRMSVLHILGRHEEADELFQDYVSQAAGDDLWTESAIGHKIRGTPVHGMRHSPELQKVDLAQFGPRARRWLFVTQVVDRVPSADTVAALDTFADPPMAIGSGGVMVAGPERWTVGPAVFATSAGSGTTAAHSAPAYFALVLASLRSGDTAQAARLCQEQARYYNFLADRSFAAPYCGYALLSEGRRADVQAMLDKRLELGRKYLVNVQFTGRMLAALLAGFAGDADAALGELQVASRRHGGFGTAWMPDDHTVLTVAEWLAERLGDSRFTAMAVDMARGKSAFMPGLAFYPAFVALHSHDRDERIEAAGRALHLDRDSYWLSQVPADIRADGGLWLARENPYGPPDTWDVLVEWVEWLLGSHR